MKFQIILIPLYLALLGGLNYGVYTLVGLQVPLLVLLAATIVMYLLCCAKNPGFIDAGQAGGGAQEVNPGELATEKAASEQVNKVHGQEDKAGIVGFSEKLDYLGFGAEGKPKMENRYCVLCKLHQPYRSRHCHQCFRCVATSDHHCPWLANCVGEKNRHLFYFFLLFQSCQLFLCTFLTCRHLADTLAPSHRDYAFLCFEFMFLSLSLGLLSYHTYLMCLNVTTWQMARWDRIDYLHQLPKYKSPFSGGTCRNVGEYWYWAFRRDRKIWEFEAK